MSNRNPQAGLTGASERTHSAVDPIYRSDSRLIVATLISLLGDFDLDEAIFIAARLPMTRKGTVEVRPVIEIPSLPA